MIKKNASIHWIAHRGDCENQIENTLQSIQTAIDNGIKYIEIDVQLTRDSLPILFHDNNLKRMFKIKNSICNVNFDVINQRPLRPSTNKKLHYANYYIPTLLQVVSLIQQYPNVTLYVEIKNINFAFFSYQHVYKTLLNCLQPILQQIVIIGFSYRFLRLVKKKSTLPIAYVLPSWKHYSEKMLANLQPNIIFSEIEIIPKNTSFHTKKRNMGCV